MVTQELSSFNAPLNVADNSALEPDDGVRESYTDLRNRWGVDHSEVRRIDLAFFVGLSQGILG